MKNKKSIAFITAITIMLFIFSVLFISVELNHDCIGVNCSICEQITVCEEYINEFGLGIGITALSTIISFGFLFKLIYLYKNKTERQSLVSLKIEMLN